MKQLEKIKKIKKEREEFVRNFKSNNPLNEELLLSATSNLNLKSLRVHKYITSTGEVGKVSSSRFLSSIGLSEKTRFKEINNVDIKKIVDYLSKL